MRLFTPKQPKPQEISVPRTVRMPTEQDPNVLAAAQRTREAALRRSGRLSTIMTDATQRTTGSSGRKLGA